MRQRPHSEPPIIVTVDGAKISAVTNMLPSSDVSPNFAAAGDVIQAELGIDSSHDNTRGETADLMSQSKKSFGVQSSVNTLLESRGWTELPTDGKLKQLPTTRNTKPKSGKLCKRKRKSNKITNKGNRCDVKGCDLPPPIH